MSRIYLDEKPTSFVLCKKIKFGAKNHFTRGIFYPFYREHNFFLVYPKTWGAHIDYQDVCVETSFLIFKITIFF
jgi:hypothetical protein